MTHAVGLETFGTERDGEQWLTVIDVEILQGWLVGTARWSRPLGEYGQ